MNIETGTVLGRHAAISPAWRAVLPALAACLLAILAMYWPTAQSMIAIWSRSDTFAHGFLIVPIVLVLVWTRRRELALLAPAPDVLGFLLLGAAGAAWLAAHAGQVQVIEQYAMAAMFPAAVVSLAGRRVALALAFPLAFLFFAVPVGEGLIPPMMRWTADFTVTALQLTGIPVYREGLYFTIPSGNWSIVEGCSGLRYLIASVTVGTLFAYLSYEQLWKRALFIALAIAVPLVANGLRAYMIVMIAHLSDMQLALGVDHFIYGWVFFGLVMLLLFWIGSFWRDPPPAAREIRAQAAESDTPARPMVAASVAAALGIAAAGPAYAAWLERPAAKAGALTLEAPRDAAGWARSSRELTEWRPHYDGAAAELFEVYRKGDRAVALYLGYYRDQRQDAELVKSTNVMVVQKHPVWAKVGEARRAEHPGGESLTLRETRLRSAAQRLLIWDWFWISGEHLVNPYLAKLYLARDKLLGRGDGAAAIIVAAPYEERAEEAERTLREFAADMLPEVEAALAAVEGKR